MNENLKSALKEAENQMPGFKMVKAYDFGSFYYFSCKNNSDDEIRTGPCIDKKTLKRIPMSSSDLVLLGDFKSEILL